MSNKSFGLQKEREYKNNRLKEDGIVSITRAAGSLGAVDLVLLRAIKGSEIGVLELVSVKASRKRFWGLKGEIRKLQKLKVPKMVNVVKKVVVAERNKWSEYSA